MYVKRCIKKDKGITKTASKTELIISNFRRETANGSRTKTKIAGGCF